MENEVESSPFLLRPLEQGDQPLLDELNADKAITDYLGTLTDSRMVPVIGQPELRAAGEASRDTRRHGKKKQV
jgi:hypothetical protein